MTGGEHARPVPHAQRTGVVVVRVGSRPTPWGIRARITEASDIATREHVVRVTSSIDEVVEIVRLFLERFARDVSVTDR